MFARIALPIFLTVQGLLPAASLSVSGDVYYQLRPDQQPTTFGQLYIGPATPGNQHVSLTPTVNSAGQPVINSGAGASMDNGNPFDLFTASASGSTDAIAWFGTLHALTEASASVDPSARINTVGPEGANPFYPAAYSSGSASFSDSIQVFDPNFPLGTLVTFFMSGIVDGTFGGTFGKANYGGSIGVQTSVGDFGLFGFYGSDDCCGCCGRRTVTAKNGEIVTIGASVEVNARTFAGFFDNSGLTGTIDSATISANAFDTMHVYLDPITAGLELISTSGHNYMTGAPSDEPTVSMTDTPEPASFWLTAAGASLLMGLAFVKRQRRLKRWPG